MPALFRPYNHFGAMVARGAWISTPRLILVTAAYAFDPAHTEFAQVSPHVIAPSAAHPVGGPAVAAAIDAAGLKAAKVAFANLTAAFRSAVVYADATVGGIAKPVLFQFVPDDTADQVFTATSVDIAWHADGVCTIAVT